MVLTRGERIDRAISALDFRKEVPEDVVTRFEDVKDLLEAAKENRRMLRVAIEYTMTSVELALRLLCARLGFEEVMEKDSNHTLPNLLQWLNKSDYLPHLSVEEPEDRPRSPDEEFDRDLPGMYQALRSLRNSWIHTRDASWLGWGFLRTIPREADFINRLYKAPRQRREARKKRREVNRHCNRLKKSGVALVCEGARHLLHEVNMLYCGVSEQEDAYYFAMWPVFEVDFESGVSAEEYAPYLAKCTSVCLEDRGEIALTTRQGTSLLLDPDLNAEEKDRLENWDSKRGRSTAFMQAGPSGLRILSLGLDQHSWVWMHDLNWID